MKHIRCMLAAALLSILPFAALAADQENFNRQVRALYGFSPHKLDPAQIEAKSAELDVFWTMVGKNPATYLPLLRAALTREDNPAFFYYDGARLLLSQGGDNADDKRLALSAIPRADLRDIQPADYLRTVHSLAVEGYDSSAAAFHILSDPEFTAFIAQHALTLGQDYSLIYMLLPTREEYYVDEAIARFRATRDPVAMDSLLKLLWYIDTPEADAAIEWASDSGDIPEDISNMATAASDARAEARASSRGGSAADYRALREERRKRMRGISDEALMELDDLTNRMKAMRE